MEEQKGRLGVDRHMGDAEEMSTDEACLTCADRWGKADSGGLESYTGDSRLLIYGLWDL